MKINRFVLAIFAMWSFSVLQISQVALADQDTEHCIFKYTKPATDANGNPTSGIVFSDGDGHKESSGFIAWNTGPLGNGWTGYACTNTACTGGGNCPAPVKNHGYMECRCVYPNPLGCSLTGLSGGVGSSVGVGKIIQCLDWLKQLRDQSQAFADDAPQYLNAVQAREDRVHYLAEVEQINALIAIAGGSDNESAEPLLEVHGK